MTQATHSGHSWWLLTATACVVLASGCGRSQFDLRPVADASGDDDDASADAAPIDPSLIAWLLFEDDPTDSVADAAGPAASCVTTCPTRVPGPRGTAYKFDGIGDALVTPDEARFRLATGTLALWIHLDGWPPPSEFACLVGKPFSTASANSWELYLFGITTTAARLEGGGDSGPGIYAQSPWAAGLGTWVHVAMTWDPSSIHIYVDAVEVSTAGGVSMTFDSHPLAIGADLSDTVWSRFVAASVDDLRIYNRVVSLAELAALALP